VSRLLWPLLAVVVFAAPAGGQVTSDVPAGRPDAVVDLATAAGVSLVQGAWRYSDVSIVRVNHRGVGPDLKPSGAPAKAYDIAPHAGEAAYDDRKWQVIPPETLTARRSRGRLSFAWYRINLTVPEKIGSFSTPGATIVFEVVVDDYAEIWVDGRLPLTLGQAGGQFAKGFNAPNRVVLTHDARPGQQIQLAVFGANGPLSSPPPNFIWVRSATLDFHRPSGAGSAVATAGDVLRVDRGLDGVVAPGTPIEKVASGFGFTEGPVWTADGLLFSDPDNNFIYRWSPDGQVTVYRTKSGYSGIDIGDYKQPGSNGLALDAEGRLTIAEHGNRRISRIEKNGVVTVLADRFEGRRLNSPNDLVYRSDGALYFTDPPFGLPQVFKDARKELPFSGVFRLSPDGTLQLVARELTGPNGLAFSPDEKYLYVTNWDLSRKVVMRYAVAADGTLGEARVFFDMTGAPGEEALDGVKVDRAGNLFVSGPGGVWILSPEGTHLGTIRAPELPANMAWGDADGRTLYMTARTGLYRMRVNVPGASALTRP
jgi:gluconolactonase